MPKSPGMFHRARCVHNPKVIIFKLSNGNQPFFSVVFPLTRFLMCDPSKVMILVLTGLLLSQRTCTKHFIFPEGF
jgi:hypothetical protein